MVLAVRGPWARSLGRGRVQALHASKKTGWRRFVGPRGSDAIELIGTTRLTPRHSVHVVQWEGQILLIGCSDQTIALLAESTPKPGAGTGPLADASMPADRSGDA
ncbi:flagellar biosynthetic protein FliO [Variovorax sp. LG9.2]|uniref:flagellar biosynthetic protein FliO n=1 Tax=unclassified Variovorax TaxID=663243 RepID=UPI003A5990F0